MTTVWQSVSSLSCLRASDCLPSPPYTLRKDTLGSSYAACRREGRDPKIDVMCEGDAENQNHGEVAVFT